MSNGQKPVNGQQQLTLEPMQAVALVTLDMCCVVLQTAANQLGGFLKIQREADIVVNALSHLQRDKQRLVEDWQRRVVIAPAGSVPPSPIIPSKQ